MAYSFSTALSGLRTSSEALNVTGNNIANSNTTGFRSSEISFSDVYASALGVRLNGAGNTLQVGNGVQVAAIRTNFTQSGFADSGSATSAAIQGNGFFVLADKEGSRSFTRAGEFTIDRDGYLTTPDGNRVQGYRAVSGAIDSSAPPQALRVPLGETLAPQATTTATLRVNLNSTAADTAVFNSPVQVFDSRGESHTLNLKLTKTSGGNYTAVATLDGDPAQISVDGAPASNAPVNFTFASDGMLLSPQTLAVVPDQTQLGGATLPQVDIALRETNPDGTPGASNFTNYAAASNVSATLQDGFAAGTLTSISAADADGTLYAVFNNGQTRPIGQFALATFTAEAGLSHLSGTRFGETPGSGQPSIGAAGSGGRGAVVGGVVEQSNVDLATEFTNLIVAQRGFQANSRVITTLNQTLQDLLQIV